MVSGPRREYAGHFNAEGSRLPPWLQGIVVTNRLARVTARGDSSTVASLIDGLSNADPCLRLSSAKTLAIASNFGDEQVLEALLNCHAGCQGVDDKDADVRLCSVESVATLAAGSGHARVCEKLLIKFQDEDWAVRQASIMALSRVIDSDSNGILEHIFSIMKQNTWWAKVAAAEALGHIASRGNKEAIQHLISILNDEDWAVRKSSCLALGKIAEFGDSRIVAQLLDLLGDADWRVRKAAIESVGDLASLGCELAIGGLMSRLEDKQVGERKLLDTLSLEDCDVKMTAVKSLIRVARPGDARVIDALNRLCRADPSCRQAVQQATADFAALTL